MVQILILFIPLLLGSLYLKGRPILNPLFLSLIGFYLSLSMLDLGILNITPIDRKTWIYLYVNFIVLIFGAFIGSNVQINKKSTSLMDTYPIKYFYIFLIISGISIMINLGHLISSTNGLIGLLTKYNVLYANRLVGNQSQLIPYFGSLIYISCSLGGFILASRRSKNYLLYSVIPLILVLFDSIVNFGRANLIIGFLSFFISYFFSAYRLNNLKFSIKFSSIFKFTIIFFSLLYLLVLIRGVRGGLENYNLNKSNIVVEKLIDYGLLSPSLIIYFAAPPSVLCQTFDSNLVRMDDVPLENTFAPLSRFYESIFEKEVGRYEDYVHIGIRKSNTGTMFKDFFLDFGLIGSILFTLFLGLFWGLSHNLYLKGNYIVLYSLFGTFIIMGVFVNLFRSGQFFIPFFTTCLFYFFEKIKWKLH